MSLSLDDVHRIARLARIDIDATQAQATLAQLNDIFAMIERMQKVDTTGIEPMGHPVLDAQRLRDDVAEPAIDREANLRNAPQQDGGLFLVPKVIE